MYFFPNESVKFLKVFPWIFLKNPRSNNHLVLHDSQVGVIREWGGGR